MAWTSWEPVISRIGVPLNFALVVWVPTFGMCSRKYGLASIQFTILPKAESADCSLETLYSAKVMEAPGMMP